MRADLEELKARLAAKRSSLAESDAAINGLTNLIVSAVNGEAVTENGMRLSVAEVVKSADALRQIHALLGDEVAALERSVKNEQRLREFATSRLGKLIAQQLADEERAAGAVPPHP